MFEIEICIDVPDLTRGVRFYADAFGFSVSARPYPGVAKLTAGAARITLLEKREQSRPSPNTQDVRHYSRHWTPVHLDFHVEDVKAALDKGDAGRGDRRAVLRQRRFWPGGVLRRSLRQRLLSAPEDIGVGRQVARAPESGVASRGGKRAFAAR